MRVILAHNNLFIAGGAEVFYQEAGRVLSAHGNDVAYFSSKDGKNPQNEWERYFPRVAEYKKGSLVKRVFDFRNMVYSRTARDCMKRLIDDFRPDIVHAFAIHGRLTPSILDACREAGVPAVMSCNDYKHICPNYKMYHHGRICAECVGGRFYRAALNRCCKGSLVYSVASAIESYAQSSIDIYRKNISIFLFASEFMANKTGEFWGADVRWKLLRNPFNSPSFACHPGYDDYLLYFGRLIDEKGVDVLLKAMAHAPRARLKIVGNGPQEAELRELAKGLNLNNVEFVGPKWGDGLNALLFRARFVVVPSTWHENFPYVILQSFAAGKAVLGSDRGGIPELIEHGRSGFIYTALDHRSLAEYINILWDDKKKAVQMGIDAKEWADENFNDARFFADIMRIYREALDARTDIRR